MILGRVPELLAPAGNEEKFSAALTYGADAVYLGGESLNLRASNAGFTGEGLLKAVARAHAAGRKVYYCLNSFPYEREMRLVAPALEETAAAGVDALIVADPGVIRLARRHAPGLALHLSTQANTCNAETVAFWADQGISRVNIARELGLRDIRRLVEARPDMEFEFFAHGAQCLAISGQGLLSAWMNNRPANQGRCTQPCRFAYRALAVEEEKRPGEWTWEAVEEEPFSTFWAPQDLCLVKYLRWFAKIGAAALKIEKRMRSSGYVAQVTDVYATALKALAAREFSPAAYLAELAHSAGRPLSSGFFLPRRVRIPMPDQGITRPIVARIAGPLEAGGNSGGLAWEIDVRALWQAELPAGIILPGLRRPTLEAGEYRLFNHNGAESAVLNPGTRAALYLEEPIPDLQAGIFLRA